jgi:hypothetical protein
MADRNITRATLDELPRVSRKLKLLCCRCGTRAVYDVGAIFCDSDGEEDTAKLNFTFTNYVAYLRRALDEVDSDAF